MAPLVVLWGGQKSKAAIYEELTLPLVISEYLTVLDTVEQGKGA